MKKLYTVLVLLMVSVSFVNAQPAFEQRSLEEALNPDGTLKRGVQGSFKVEGYTMRTGKNGEPIFVPQTQHTASGTWSSLGTGSSNGVLGGVLALAVVGNEVYVGGEFTQAGGVSANNVARFNTQTNTWSTLGTGSQNGVNGFVTALAVSGNEVVVGGAFTEAGGVSANRVARFNTQTNTWSTLGTGSQNGVNDVVYALAVVGNEVVVGGDFTSAGGVSANRVARFNTQTNTWSTLGTGSQNGVLGFVTALAVVGNEVVVGGFFTSAGGVSANSVARFNTQTNTWSTLGTGSSNGVLGAVAALAVVGNEVFVGGGFTQAGGVSANSVARFNTQTNTWSTLGTGSSNGVSGDSLPSVNALAVVGNEVYVGGTFTSAGGVRANRVARFNTQTNTWSTLGTGSQNGVNGFVTALAVSGNEVVVGGAFTEAGGVRAICVARWNSGTSRVEQLSPTAPKTFLLEQNYPNPFNPSTTIRYQLPVASEVKLEVYDVLGKKVATLVSERQAAGYYQYVWNANGLTSGVYFYRLQAGGFVETKKMMLVK
jgi:N-acetylneuraminic acid mutarotase